MNRSTVQTVLQLMAPSLSRARHALPEQPRRTGAFYCRFNWRLLEPCVLKRRSGFGLNEVIGIAAGIIIAVVIVIPGLQSFATNVLSQLTTWWNGMAADIFQN